MYKINMNENSTEATFNEIKSKISSSDNKVLEIGCGDGRITKLLAEIVDELIAIDPFAESIRKAKRLYPNINFQVGTGEELEFYDDTFDIVIFTLSLHHQNSKKALSEAQRVTKDGGIIIVVEPVIGNELGDLCRYIHNEDEDKIKAQDAIKEFGKSQIYQKTYEAEWTFDDKNECYNYLFSYYDIPFDISIVDKIESEFDLNMNTKPLIIKERQQIQILRV